MSQFRRQARITLDGTKHEVGTNALDWKGIKIDADGRLEILETMRIMHNALLRHEIEGVPRHFDQFAERIDDFGWVDGDDPEPDDMDPTRPDPSGG